MHECIIFDIKYNLIQQKYITTFMLDFIAFEKKDFNHKIYVNT